MQSESNKRWLTVAIVVNFLVQVFVLFVFVVSTAVFFSANTATVTSFSKDNIIFAIAGVISFLYVIGLVGLWRYRAWGRILFSAAFSVEILLTLSRMFFFGERGFGSIGLANILPLWLIVLAARHKDSFTNGL